jgi:hypoxanthine phosphoribosyltransferase
VLVPILTGSIIFVADLMRELPHKVRINTVTVTSYPGKATASKGAAIAGSLPADDELTGKHVLIVDDILDSGSTIRLVREEVQRRPAPSSTACCARPAVALATPANASA